MGTSVRRCDIGVPVQKEAENFLELTINLRIRKHRKSQAGLRKNWINHKLQNIRKMSKNDYKEKEKRQNEKRHLLML